MTNFTTCQILKKVLIHIGVNSASDFTDFSLGPEPKRERNRDIVRRVVFLGDTLQSAATAHDVNKKTIRCIAWKTSRKLAKTKGCDIGAVYRAMWGQRRHLQRCSMHTVNGRRITVFIRP